MDKTDNLPGFALAVPHALGSHVSFLPAKLAVVQSHLVQQLAE